jgi:GcrA cell cycle regulator
MSRKWVTPKDKRDEIERLWLTGMPTKEMAANIGFTKNQVIGLVHRMGLTPRPSPIKGGGPSGNSKRDEARARGEVQRAAREKRTIADAAVKREQVKFRPMYLPRPTACCWPNGDPGTPGFHFCGVPSAPGRPYCSAHARIAYRTVAEYAEEAA